MTYLTLIMHDVGVDAVLAQLAELGVHVTVIETPAAVTTPPAAPVERVNVRVHALPPAPFRVRTRRPVEVFGGPSTSSGARLRLLPEGNESMVVRQVWLKVSDAPELWVAYEAEALEVVE